MASGTAAILAMVGIAACYANPALDLNNGNFHVVQPNPAVMWVKAGDSSQLLLRLVNDNNNGAVTSFTLSGVPAGIVVHYDATYRPYYLGGSDTLIVPTDKDQQRYFVLGVAPGLWSFNATATANTSATGTIQVRVEPINLGAAIDRTTGLHAGDTVTITAPANVVFSSASAVTFDKGSSVVAGVSADSTSIRVVIGPGDSGAVSVTKVGMPYGTSVGALTLKSTNGIDLVPNVTVAPTTLSTAAPAFGATMTVTLGGNLRFTSTSTVSIGGQNAFILSRSADSSTATIVPIAGSTGTISYTNVVLSFLNAVNLSVPGDKSVTAGSTFTGDANAGSIATASTWNLPAVGATTVFSDGGAFTAGGPCAISALQGNGCRYYKIVTTATHTYNLDLRWGSATNTDLGVYLLNSAGTGTGSSGSADAHGAQAGGPETGSFSNLPAGTYYIAIVWYNSGPQAPFFHLQITTQ